MFFFALLILICYIHMNVITFSCSPDQSFYSYSITLATIMVPSSPPHYSVSEFSGTFSHQVQQTVATRSSWIIQARIAGFTAVRFAPSLWSEQSACVNVVASINTVFSLSFFLSFRLGYFCPRRGCPRVLKFCMES
jgi:hypothetical protein